MARRDEPMYYEPPPYGIDERDVAIGACYDCEEIIGPMDADDVGYDLWVNHEGHDTEAVGTWTERYVFDEEAFFETREERQADVVEVSD